MTTESLDFAESVRPYNKTVTAKGGCGNYHFSVIKGALPAGLTLDKNTGKIHGTNTAWGTHTPTMLVMDRRFPVNATKKTYTFEAYMGEKLHGEDCFVFPHFVSGTFNLDIHHTKTKAFPGDIQGGTPGNLRYTINVSTIPERFKHSFDPLTGQLSVTELTPVSCKQYKDALINVEIEAKDHVHTNNTMTFNYEIPAECLDY